MCDREKRFVYKKRDIIYQDYDGFERNNDTTCIDIFKKPNGRRRLRLPNGRPPENFPLRYSDTHNRRNYGKYIQYIDFVGFASALKRFRTVDKTTKKKKRKSRDTIHPTFLLSNGVPIKNTI